MIYLFIYLFNKYFFIAYYKPGTLLGARHKMINKTYPVLWKHNASYGDKYT